MYQQESVSIKAWQEEDRPREKLLVKGRSALSDAELIAILLGSGSPGESAVSLARKILASVSNNLNDLGRLSATELQQFGGMGPAKAVTLMAALELGRRRMAATPEDKPKIKSSEMAYEMLSSALSDLPHEEFWVLYLSHSNQVLSNEQLSKGGISGTVVDVRLALKRALQLGAVALILAHNHPGGTLKPSEADKQLTQKLKQAALLLDIKVLDHLIIAEKAYFSFADEQLL